MRVSFSPKINLKQLKCAVSDGSNFAIQNKKIKI